MRNNNLINKKIVKNKSIENYVSVKINVKNVQFWIFITSILVHTILLMVLFIYSLFDNVQKRMDPEITDELKKQLEGIFVKTIIAYVINNSLNFIFIFYIFLAKTKIKVGYFFVIFWSVLWILIIIGSFTLFLNILIILIINVIACLGILSTLFWLFYDLFLRRTQINYEKIKKRNSL